MGKFCPKHVELILEINKTVIVASSWCSILLYLHWWCTGTHKASLSWHTLNPLNHIVITMITSGNLKQLKKQNDNMVSNPMPRKSPILQARNEVFCVFNHINKHHWRVTRQWAILLQPASNIYSLWTQEARKSLRCGVHIYKMEWGPLKARPRHSSHLRQRLDNREAGMFRR
jgi:hypothetical protein